MLMILITYLSCCSPTASDDMSQGPIIVNAAVEKFKLDRDDNITGNIRARARNQVS